MDNPQEKEGIIKKSIDMVMKKGFKIEVGDDYDCPTPKEFLASIEEYAKKSGETLEFTNKIFPVTFYLDKTLYRGRINMNRGGYFIHCKEV